jgi:predicted TIM-barrel fold metal-dependent hydrolase
MRIDVHCHGWTPQYFEHLKTYDLIPARVIDTLAGMGAMLTGEALQQRFQLMAAAGVEKQVLSAAGMCIYPEDEAAAARFARFHNDDYAQVVSENPDRLAALAAIPISHTDAALTEIAHALDDLGMAGIGLHTSIGDLSPADEQFDPVWEELDRRGATVFFHPAGNAAQSALINRYKLPWVLGAPVEATFLASHLIQRAMPLRYPHVKFILAHLGGAIPMLIGRFNEQPSIDDRFETEETPGQLARRLYYDCVVNRHHEALRNAVESLGADHIVLGTDYPWESGERYISGVRYVQESGLDHDVAKLILDRTLDPLLPTLVG